MSKRKSKLTGFLISAVMILILFIGVSYKVDAAEIYYYGSEEEKTLSAKNVTLTLNHNTYVYNGKGIRLRGKSNYFKKNKKVVAVGKLKRVNDVKRYYILIIRNVKNSKDWYEDIYWLPYKTIKGQEYYQIGSNKYIKCINVEKLNEKDLFTNWAIVTTVPSNNIQADELIENTYTLKLSNKILPGNKNYVVDREDIFDNEECPDYHIKNTKYYIYCEYIVKEPRQTVDSHPIKHAVVNKNNGTTYY